MLKFIRTFHSRASYKNALLILCSRTVVLVYVSFRRRTTKGFMRQLSIVIPLLFFLNVSVKADFDGAWTAYENGKYNIAVREFLRCAERGNDKCQLYLGDIYRYGHGTVVRKDKALDWYLRSVDQKNPVAAMRLYSLYLNNSALQKNNIKAYMWFKIAKVLGRDLSLEKEAKLRSGMTSEQVTESQRLATEWWMTHQ